jgi:hypothetical protein
MGGIVQRSDVLVISDLDSVVCQTVPAAVRWIWDHYQVVVPESDIVVYDAEIPVKKALSSYGLQVTERELADALRAGCWDNPAFFRALEPRPEIWAALWAWQEAGAALQLCTRRSKHLRAVTAAWLKDHGFRLDEYGKRPALDGVEPLVLEADKVALAKAGRAQYQRVIFLEDALHHARAIGEQGDGTEVWLTIQPWNQQAAENDFPGQRLPDTDIAQRLAALREAALMTQPPKQVAGWARS